MSAAGAGLVSASTTCRGFFSPLLPSESVVQHIAEHTIQIDPVQARVTRLRKGIGVGAKCLHNAGGKGQRMWLVTLTYKGDNANWRAEQISRFLDFLRKWHYKRTGSSKVRYACG